MQCVPKTKNNLSKIKQRRRRVAFGILVLLIILILYFILRPRNYTKEYSIEDYKVIEKFNKSLKIYSFEMTKEDATWHFVVEHNYMNTRKLIQSVKFQEKDNEKCIIPESEQLSTYPQCLKDNNPIDFHLIKEELKQSLDQKYFEVIPSRQETYEKIDLKSLDENTYYIWNYKGFYIINKNEKKNIPIFDKDIYDIKAIKETEDYLVIPDYEEQYYFNKFYLINLKENKLSTWEFKDSLYFDGYYLGVYDNNLFYVDKKNKIEWEISPNRKKMRKVGTNSKEGKIYKNGWEKISLNKLTTDTYQFEFEETYHYEIKEDGFYIKYLNCETPKKISNKKPKTIVKTLGNKVYYLVDSSLYYYTEKTGEVLIMNYFEWNFNHQNMIFIKEG